MGLLKIAFSSLDFNFKIINELFNFKYELMNTLRYFSFTEVNSGFKILSASKNQIFRSSLKYY